MGLSEAAAEGCLVGEADGGGTFGYGDEAIVEVGAEYGDGDESGYFPYISGRCKGELRAGVLQGIYGEQGGYDCPKGHKDSGFKDGEVYQVVQNHTEAGSKKSGCGYICIGGLG